MRGRGGEAAEEGEEDDGWDATIRLVGYLFARTRGVQRAAGAVVQCTCYLDTHVRSQSV